MQLLPSVIAAAQRHAREAYPKESCGLAVGDAYWVCENEAANPTKSFAIHDKVLAKAEKTGELRAVIHSHPDGFSCPSAADMAAQAAMDLPWAIIVASHDKHTGAVDTSDPILFGDCLGMAPAVGRVFVHGWHDCYATIRDTYRKGGEALAAETVDWPLPPHELPDQPRDVNWWAEKDKDLYLQNYKRAGFREIAREEARPGDVFLASIPDPRENPLRRLNHGGVLLHGNLILHHLPGRLSRREPVGNWLRAIRVWLRHEISDAQDAAQDKEAEADA